MTGQVISIGSSKSHNQTCDSTCRKMYAILSTKEAGFVLIRI